MKYAIAPRNVSISLKPFFILNVGIHCPITYTDYLTDLTVHKLFYTRADLHRTVYQHAKVKVNVETQSWLISKFTVEHFNHLFWTLFVGNRTHVCRCSCKGR